LEQEDMMRTSKVTGVALCVMSLLLATAACGSGSSSGGQPNAGSTAGAKQPLNIAVDLSDLTTLDPERALANAMQLILPMEGNTLLDVNPSNPTQLLPSLATKWGCNSTATTCTVTIRPNVHFSTGRILTSADVVYTFERMLHVQGGPAFLLSTMKSARAVGSDQVKFILSQPDSAFLSKLAAAGLIILDSKALQQNGGSDASGADKTDKAETYLNRTTVGSGPYMLQQWVKTQKVVFVPNPHYWGPAPNFSKITLLDVPQASTQAQLLRGGEADIALNVDPVTAKSLKSASGVTVQIVHSLNLIMLCLDNSSPGLSNVKVRQAIASAVNYNAIVQGLGGGAQRPAATVPLGLQGAAAAAPTATNVAHAKSLMQQAGVGHLTLNATFANNVAYGIPLTTLWQALQSDLSAIGITVKLHPVDYNTWVNQLLAKKLSLTSGIWSPDYLDSSDYFGVFGETGGTNSALFHMNVPGSPQLFNQYLKTVGSQREALAGQLVKKMQADATFIPLIQPNSIFAYRSDVSGVQYSPNKLLNLATLKKQ
jgi:peptide/nickel transport system substrate-binding protein